MNDETKKMEQTESEPTQEVKQDELLEQDLDNVAGGGTGGKKGYIGQAGGHAGSW